MVREQEELSEVARAKERLRIAAARPSGTNKAVRAATGILGLVLPVRRLFVQSKQRAVGHKQALGPRRRGSSRPLLILAGAGAAAFAAGLLLRRSADGRRLS